MDLYKKKSLKFSGMGRGVRCAELDAARRSSRLQRFSLLRPIDDDDDVPKENVSSSSRIPTLGKQNSQIPTREERLKKWKEEKMLKKKLEEQSKKPTFKAGGFAPNLKPSLASNRFGELSRIQGLSSKSNSSIKPSSSIKSNDIGCKSNPVKSQANSIKFQASKSKNDVTKPTIARPQAIGKIPPINLKINNITIRNPKPPTTTKPILKETKSKDLCVPSYTKPKVAPANLKPSVTTALDLKTSKKTSFSGITKPTTSLMPQRKPQKEPSKIAKPAVKSSNPALAKQSATGRIPIEAKDSRKPAEKSKVGERPSKNEAVKSGIGKGQPKKEVKDSAFGNVNSSLQCQTSLNEAEKSFAPMGFIFRPPVELQFSFASGISPFEIFESLKNDNPRTSTPKQSEWKEYKDLDSTFSQETPNIAKSAFVKDSCSVPSSETQFIKCLLDNSPSETELSVPNFPLDKSSEDKQDLKGLHQKENSLEILSKINPLEARLSGQPSKTAVLDEFHPKLDSPNTDQLETEQSHLASSDTTNSQIIATETELNKIEFCLPAQNETKTDISVHVPKNSIEARGSLESEQRTALEFCSPLKDLESNAIPELDLPLKNLLDPLLLEMGQTANAPSVTCSTLSTLEEDEVGSLSDGILGQAISKGTKSKRFTRSCRQSEKPTLVKISESPENKETPKRAGRAKALERVTAGEFTPRRSRRLARLSEFNSEENLFDVRESLYSSPGTESSQLTYDFDRLHLESKDSSEVFHRYSTRSSTLRDREVSLLYTPPRARKSTRKTVKGDLISFSPSI